MKKVILVVLSLFMLGCNLEMKDDNSSSYYDAIDNYDLAVMLIGTWAILNDDDTWGITTTYIDTKNTFYNSNGAEQDFLIVDKKLYLIQGSRNTFYFEIESITDAKLVIKHINNTTILYKTTL